MSNKLRFERIGNSYERALKLFPECRTDHQWLVRNLGLKKHENVLEITAGSGFFTAKLASLLPEGHVLAQDISKTMLGLSKSRCKDYKNVSYYLEPSSLLPKLEDNSFDKAVCLGGFHHIENQVEIVRAVFNKLKKGGIFCIGDFADDSKVQKYFDFRINEITDDGHFGRFLSKSGMLNLGRRAGFSNIEAVYRKANFIFKRKSDVGLFFQLVHKLNQKPDDTLLDIEKYMGVKKIGNQFIVPMDYIYSKYVK